MGAGRNTRTYTLAEKSKQTYSINGSITARNLALSDLGGVIFGCKHKTMKECLAKKLFGLPAQHFSYVRNVQPGLPLFLFNYSDRKLHGIFEAASQGRLNIDPHGWAEDGSDTLYSAQVKMRIKVSCQPLVEKQFGPIISGNYYDSGLFWFELDREQTSKLISLLSSSPIVTMGNSISLRTENSSALPRASSASNARLESSAVAAHDSSGLSYSSVVKNMSFLKNDLQHASDLAEETEERDVVHLESNNNQSCSFSVGGNNTVPPQKKWSSLFATENTESAGRNFENMRSDSNYQSAGSSSAATMSTFIPLGTIGGIARPNIGQINEESFETNSACSDEAYKKLLHSFVQPFLDGQSESSESPRAGHRVQFSGNDILCSENMSCQHTNMFCPTGSFDSHSVIAKLVQEVEELKFSNHQYTQRISSLEQDLADSRQEFQQLKDQFNLFKIGHTAEAAPQSSYEGHSNLDEWVVLVGGYNGTSWLVDLDLYSFSNDLVKPLCPMSSVRSYSSAALLNGELYIFGGVSGHTWYDTVESYNPSSNLWVSRPALNRKKGSLAGVSLNEKIFAIGGGNGVECFSEVEMFDQHLSKWIYSQPMLHKRFSAAAATLDGVMYVSGGFDGKDYLKSMERLDPRECSWVQLGSMSMKRACHSVAVLDKKLYALGGYDGSSMVPTVEVYDPYMNKWMMGEPMKNPRGYFSSVVIKNAIYAIGGLRRSNELLDEVECYEESMGWQVANLTSIGKRAFFSAVQL